MRRLAVCSILLLCAVALLIGCGHKSSGKPGPPAKVVLAVSSTSLAFGAFTTLSANVQDSNGNVLTNPTITFTASDPSLATISTPVPGSTNNAGETLSIAASLCAGAWGSNFQVCTPPSSSQGGSVQITASNGTITSDPVTVFVHPRIDRLLVTPAKVDCVSAGQTQQMTAQALSNTQGDITSTVGPIAWSSSNSSIVGIDANGLATATVPGIATIVAAVGTTVSPVATFITCPVAKISIHVKDDTATSFTLDTAGTKTLAADIVDSKGSSISPPLSWFSSQPAAATVTNTGVVTAASAGASTIVAQCAASGCNIGQSPVFSNVVTASVNGTTATTVYAAGTSATSLVPIDTSNNTAGTAITLPSTPDSMRVNRLGTRLFLGNSTAIMVVDTTANSVTTIPNTPGTVLAVSPDGNTLLIFNAATSTLSLLNSANGSGLASLTASGTPRGDFSVDSSTAYAVAGSDLHVLTTGGGASTIALAAAANDVNFTTQGSFAYLAGGASSAVTARATCNNQGAQVIATANTPTLIASLPNAGSVLAVDSPNLEVIPSATDGAGCPPSVPNTATPLDFGQGSFTPQQIIVLPDSSKAYVTSDLGRLLVHNVADGTVGTIPLASGARSFTGGATLDSKTLYVGVDDNTVHVIDTASGSDTKQVPVSFKPDLVAVRPK